MGKKKRIREESNGKKEQWERKTKFLSIII